MYFLLFEILRSPELYKQITGPSLRAELEPLADKIIREKEQSDPNYVKKKKKIIDDMEKQ